MACAWRVGNCQMPSTGTGATLPRMRAPPGARYSSPGITRGRQVPLLFLLSSPARVSEVQEQVTTSSNPSGAVALGRACQGLLACGREAGRAPSKDLPPHLL